MTFIGFDKIINWIRNELVMEKSRSGLAPCDIWEWLVVKPIFDQIFTCKHNLLRLKFLNSPLEVQVRTWMVFSLCWWNKTVRPSYTIKAVHSGNVIYFPLFVKYDTFYILPVWTKEKRHQPKSVIQWEMYPEIKIARKQLVNLIRASEEKQILEIE